MCDRAFDTCSCSNSTKLMIRFLSTLALPTAERPKFSTSLHLYNVHSTLRAHTLHVFSSKYDSGYDRENITFCIAGNKKSVKVRYIINSNLTFAKLRGQYYLYYEIRWTLDRLMNMTTDVAKGGTRGSWPHPPPPPC